MSGANGLERSVDVLYAYVRGDASEPVLMSELRDVPRGDVRALIHEHMGHLTAIDAARSVILESIV